MKVEEPEYEQMAAWGPVIDSKDAASAFMLSGVTDRLGVDNNEAGWLIGWLMECYERGLITPDDVNGHDLTWGNVEAVNPTERKERVLAPIGGGIWMSYFKKKELEQEQDGLSEDE